MRNISLVSGSLLIAVALGIGAYYFQNEEGSAPAGQSTTAAPSPNVPVTPDMVTQAAQGYSILFAQELHSNKPIVSNGVTIAAGTQPGQTYNPSADQIMALGLLPSNAPKDIDIVITSACPERLSECEFDIKVTFSGTTYSEKIKYEREGL